ncbi:Increased DNA methylation 1-like protein [Drosera capensis]
MLSGNISPLQDNRFGGPNSGLCNSQEVLYGCYSADTDRMSAVSEVVDVNSGQSKLDEMLHCSYSEDYFLKSQAYSQSLRPNDADTGFGMSDRNFLSDSSGVGIVCVDRDPQIIAAKRMKLTVDHPLLEDSVVSSMQLEELISGSYRPVLPQACSGLMFNVVESSSEGMISGHYVSKQGVDASDFRGRDAPTASLSGSDRSKGNTVDVHEAIASPDSQESFATKSLAVGPSPVVVGRSGSMVSAGERPKRAPKCSPPVKFEEDTLLRGNGAKDPRVLLRHRTFCLLKEAGWSIDKIKRNCRAYDEFIYTTPEGKLVREFTKAWELCGRSLLDHGTSQYIEEKQWNDLKKFWSDLFDTLRTVDNEMKDWEPTAALPLKWALLDPFVVVVFIDRKIIALKNGNAVKVKCSVAGDGSKSTIVSTSRSVGNEDKACDRPAMTSHYDCSLPTESSMLDFAGHSQEVAAQIPVTRSVCLSEGNSLTLMETPNDNGKHIGEIFAAETRDGSLTVSSSCTSHLACLQSTGCLYDDPLGFGNFEMIDRHSETFSSHQGSFSMSSASYSKQNLELSMEAKKDLEVHLFEEGDKPKERRFINKGMLLSSLADDNPNCMNHELLKSSRLDEVDWASSKIVDSGYHSWKEIKESLVDNSQCMEKKDGDLASVVDERQEMSPVAIISDVDRKSKRITGKHVQCFDSPNLENNATCCGGSFDSKKKMRKKSKKVSDIDCTTSSPTKSSEMEEGLGVNPQVGESCYNFSSSGSRRKNGKTKLKRRKFDSDGSFGSESSKDVQLGTARVEAAIGSRSKKKSRKSCKLRDDDLLITAIIQKKIIASGGTGRVSKGSKRKAPPERGTNQKGSCRLLPYSLSKGGNHIAHNRWSSLGERTVLSWLVDMGEISINQVIQFRHSKGDNVVKDGVVTRGGIMCKCCSELLSLSGFKMHAGFEPSSHCLNLFMESGKPFTLCQLQAWSLEYKAKKNGTPTVQEDESDHNDDSCGWCGDGGELLCCDNCPSTYHQACILTEELPEGSWYCPSCSCRSCGNLADEIEACSNLVDEKESTSSSIVFKCSQCEHKYHGACLGGKGLTRIGSSLWFCGGGCEEVYFGLHSRIGISYYLDDGFSWSLLRCIADDQKIHSAQWFALKAECNSKLAVALSIMEECFVSMVDPRTGINMIPHAIFNLGSSFSRLNYHGFYSVVLEKDDVLVAVASIRVHGTKLAEVPLVATCSKYRRQGMCRRLLGAIEKMLISFKVEMLVIAAIPSLVETWTVGFGFVPMEEDEKRSLNKTSLMVFPETVMLKKILYVNQDADLSQNAPADKPVKRDESAEAEAGRGQAPIIESIQQESRGCHADDVDCVCKIELMDRLVQEETEVDMASSLGSLGNKNEDNGGTVPESENGFKCSNMEVDFDKEIDEASNCQNLQPVDTQAMESSCARAIQSFDMAALQIAGDALVRESNLQREIDTDSKPESELLGDKAMCSLSDENGNQGDNVIRMDSPSSRNGSVAETWTTSAAEDGEDCRPNPCSEQCVGQSSGQHSLDRTSTAPLDPENDEEQAILEAFAAVKAVFNSYVGGLPL